ncbi:F-box/LRR-repeat protein 13-like [Lycium barbarum]|uniref:F-box/LRR-repeat protein 13-like n=1 Tax=Lycium barbarum TaxID=112863 RepID=UPI00293EF977|nr:F-box/LRR-repeat protein 13-like [Lycium barbarum]
MIRMSIPGIWWRYLWNSIHNFHFSGSNYYNKVENFVSLVDHVLTHCAFSKIKKFELDLPNNFEWNFDLNISQWISFFVEREVKDVVLCSYDEDVTFELPISIWTCSSLITLDWSCCVVDKESVIEWKLNYIFIDNDDLAKILLGCRALETPELSSFEGFHRLEITSSNLKRRTLVHHWWFYGRVEDSLEIIASYLQHLEILGDLEYLKCRLVNVDVSSLVTARLIFNITSLTSWGLILMLRMAVVVKLSYELASNWTLVSRGPVHVATQRSVAIKIEMQMSDFRDLCDKV